MNHTMIKVKMKPRYVIILIVIEFTYQGFNEHNLLEKYVECTREKKNIGQGAGRKLYINTANEYIQWEQ